jgi:hypothetical protein
MGSIFEEELKKLVYTATVRIKFRDAVLAGVPKNEDVLTYFMEARHMSEAEKDDFKKRVMGGTLTEDEKDEIKETGWCVFEPDCDGNLCLWHGNIKAMLREIFVTTGLTQKKPNTKKAVEGGDGPAPCAGGRQTFQHAVHVDPLRILFTKDKNTIKSPDGRKDRVKHISDASGKRSALGRHDFISQPEMEFFLKWPRKSIFTIDDIKNSLALAQEDGLGACRSQGFGKFDVTFFEVK